MFTKEDVKKTYSDPHGHSIWPREISYAVNTNADILKQLMTRIEKLEKRIATMSEKNRAIRAFVDDVAHKGYISQQQLKQFIEKLEE